MTSVEPSDPDKDKVDRSSISWFRQSPEKPQKYGDDDLVSKKRKPLEFSEEDEYITFSTRQGTSKELNSTFLAAEENRAFITKNPSESSFGFSNTFHVLEGQMSGRRSISPLTLEKFIKRNELYKNPLFVNAPYSCDQQKFPGILEEPSHLELELEARSRLKDLILNDSLGLGEESTIKRSLSELLEGFVVPPKINSSRESDQSTDDPTVVEQQGEYPEYLYHVSKGKDGRLYLRVVRSLLIDKGNFAILFSPRGPFGQHYRENYRNAIGKCAENFEKSISS